MRRVRAGSAMGPAMSECLACVTSANTTRKGGRPLVTSAAGFTAGREFLGRRAAGYLDSVGWGNRPPDGRAGEGRWTYEPHTHTGHARFRQLWRGNEAAGGIAFPEPFQTIDICRLCDMYRRRASILLLSIDESLLNYLRGYSRALLVE